MDLGGTVADIMNTWVLQMGFPVVTIDSSTGQLSQRHFLLDLDSNVTTPSPFEYAHTHTHTHTPRGAQLQLPAWFAAISGPFR